MLKAGLTGGIASGKSVVSEMFRDLGARIIDADMLAREALEPGRPAYHETVHIFGRRILGSDGRINRKALADIVFSDPHKRELLERVVHPKVFDEESRVYAELAEKEPKAVVFFNAALLIESGAYRRMDRVVVVWCHPETQLKRLMENGMTREAAQMRIAVQMPIDEKKKYATHIIYNDGSLADTEAQVRRIYLDFKQYV